MEICLFIFVLNLNLVEFSHFVLILVLNQYFIFQCWSNGRVQYFPMIFRDAQVTVRANTTNFSTSVNSLNDYSYYYTNSPS